MFAKNEAVWDRALRVVVGLVVLSLIFWGPKTLWGLVGIVLLVTGLSGWCALYSLLGIGTAAKTESAKSA
jgi:Inner membrane protein YgaP-like, transmembrane domain